MRASVTDQRKLLELQGLDSHTARLGAQRRKLVVLEELAQLLAQIASLERDLVESKTAVSDLRRDLNRAETSVEQVNQRALLQQERLDVGTISPKEMTAVQHELEQLKTRRTALEEEQLEVMEAFEEANNRVERINEDLESTNSDRQRLEAQRDQEFAEIDQELDQINSQRSQIATLIGQDLLAEYEEIRARTGGLGAVALIGRRVEGASFALSPAELDAIRSLEPDQIAVSEEYEVILVRVPD